MTKFVSSSLIGMWLLTGSPSFWAAHCSQRCFSIFLPPLISVRWTVAVLLQLSHFIGVPQRRSSGANRARLRHRYRHVRTFGSDRSRGPCRSGSRGISGGRSIVFRAGGSVNRNPPPQPPPQPADRPL